MCVIMVVFRCVFHVCVTIVVFMCVFSVYDHGGLQVCIQYVCVCDHGGLQVCMCDHGGLQVCIQCMCVCMVVLDVYSVCVSW